MTTTFKTTSVKSIQVFNKFATATFMRVKDYNLLLEVKFKKLYIPIPCDDNSCIRYVVEHDGNELTYAPNDIELYTSKEAYQRGDKPLHLVRYEVPLINNNHISSHEDDNHIITYTSWTMNGSVPEEVDAPIKGIIIDEFTSGAPDYSTNNIDDYYSSRKTALQYNPYSFFNQDGQIETKEGTHAFSQLTFEQECVVNHLRRVLQEANEKNIKLYFDSRSQDIYAINGNRAYIEWLEQYEIDERNCFNPEELHPTSVIEDAMFYTNTDDWNYQVVEKEEKGE